MQSLQSYRFLGFGTKLLFLRGRDTKDGMEFMCVIAERVGDRGRFFVEGFGIGLTTVEFCGFGSGHSGECSLLGGGGVGGGGGGV